MLNHARQGSGEPLVLLHGIGSHWQMWTPVLDRLTAEREVIAVDLPGFGRSDPVPGEPTVEALTDAAAAFLADAGVERPHVAGNSMGGAIALELGRRGLARTVTALSPVGFQRGREAAYASASLAITANAARLLRPAMPVLTATGVGRTLLVGQIFARPWRIPAAVMRDDVEALADAPSFDAARPHVSAYRWTHGDLDVPTTIAWGERDWLLIPRQGRRARRLMPRARHVWLSGCGHVPTWDDPEQVAGVLVAGSRE
jgi:pimeloyl-ACP methyl ester carboxylesterase